MDLWGAEEEKEETNDAIVAKRTRSSTKAKVRRVNVEMRLCSHPSHTGVFASGGTCGALPSGTILPPFAG